MKARTLTIFYPPGPNTAPGILQTLNKNLLGEKEEGATGMNNSTCEGQEVQTSTTRGEDALLWG